MPGEKQRSKKELIMVALVAGAVFVAAGLLAPIFYFVVDPSRYLSLHTLLEIGGILVGFAVFIVNWEASKQSRNAQSLFIATGFLTVAAVDTMHTLSYDGMPDFVTANGVGKATFYWLIAQLWASGVLWVAAFVRPEASGWYLGRRFLMGANLIASAVFFLVVILLEGSLPAVFVAGQGLTPLGMGLEWVIVGLSLLAAVTHARAYRSTRDDASMLVVAALVVSIFGELDFLFFLGPNASSGLLGYGYKVVAYYLLFRALLVSSVERPYRQLRVAKDHLERTVTALDARNRELDTLYDVSVAMSSTLKPEEVLELAIDKAMTVTKAGAAAIFLAEEEAGRVRLAAWRSIPDEVLARCADPSLSLPCALISSRSKPGDATVLEDPALVRSLGGTPARIAPLGLCACAPIVSKGRQLGMLAMAGVDRGAFSLGDADLLTAIGHQLGLAIENARLYERTDERLREKLVELQNAGRRSRFLVEVGELLGSRLESSEMLGLLARKTAEVVGDWCVIYLLDEREGVLHLGALYHAEEKEARAIRRVLGGRPLRVGELLAGRVAETGQPVLMAAVSREQVAAGISRLAQSLEDIAVLRRHAPASVVAAPVRARGRTVGVLVGMASHSSEPLGEAELSLMMEVADRAGVALENRQLFQENLAQRRHLETIIAQMVDGVVIADGAGRLLVVNAAAQRMLGDRMEHLLGSEKHPVRSRPRGFGRAETRSYPLVTRALAGEPVIGEEISLGEGATERILNANASPVRDESGGITGAVVVLRDVTAEREIERMKDEFVATVSHELRTPITAVLGYTDLLLRGLRGPLAPQQQEALVAVRNAGRRLLALINDILDMSRLEAGKQELSLEPVYLFVSAERALDAVSVLAAAKGISLVQSAPKGLPPVLADAEQLQRILGNLLSNAIKFTPERGTVTVAARPADDPGGGHVAVTVSDTGIGVPPEQQDKIWDKFHQVDSSSRRLYGGTGLGLAITKGLVELHGGRVWVESEGTPGKGCTFGFTLPVVQD